ncbi:hypothetical protein DdX_06987 [Ditylenchus destructor]|uniref:Uncharacterized protein n=1 Tax=Ditylenchus destructor TaxID=166010 RepID=A0AAD4N6Y2_9BILA|nr:hypothetical protein DdX_06987 [Ditylenchus destructor]
MALALPLQFFDGVCRWAGCIGPSTSMTVEQQQRLADFLVADASLFDVIRWRRISRAFRRAADRRLQNYTRIEVRMYKSLAQMHGHNCEKDSHEWHPHARVMIVEMGQNELGIAIDTKLKTDDVRALIQLLTAFRQNVQQLFIDSPIIELLVSQINRQQVNILIDLLRNSRPAFNGKESPEKRSSAIFQLNKPTGLPYGPFFPRLKKLTITSQSNQLEHLSRLLSYAVGVDFIYETSNIDLLCLKICMGTNTQWCQKPHIRLFRHVTKFRQWTEADSLGERYFQQFSGNGAGGRQKQTRH